MSASGDQPRPQRILVILSDAESVAASLDCAVAIALQPGTPIIAVHVGYHGASEAMSDEDADIEALRSMVEGAPKARLARIKAAFEAWSANAAADHPVSWRDCPGDIETCIRDESEKADLVVIGRPIHLDGRDAFHTALFHSGHLVLIAPATVTADRLTIGRHFLIGWKPGPQAERAVRAALPWLRAADRITVACVEEEGGHAYAASAAALFADLSLKIAIETLPAGKDRVGPRLIATAHAIGADCLLIGAYHHGALWEAMLGGVTRDILASADIPVFLMR